MADPRRIEMYRAEEREWLDAEEIELLEGWDALVERVEQAEAENQRLKNELRGTTHENYERLAAQPDQGAA